MNCGTVKLNAKQGAQINQLAAARDELERRLLRLNRNDQRKCEKTRERLLVELLQSAFRACHRCEDPWPTDKRVGFIFVRDQKSRNIHSIQWYLEPLETPSAGSSEPPAKSQISAMFVERGSDGHPQTLVCTFQGGS
jgi:hypothetical protein